uniref:PiggyBac transposable element-derived protein domain-containing protein n=1 Tax=Timema monikensis TaxID=170555 RepID=A0A7R9HHJ8_9NEOP|nr:unnamed protein product [Timema monikensis]
MYWETSSDTHNEEVSKAMSRNTFEDILKYLHVCDNLTLDENDKFGKVRPLWLLPNKRWIHAFPKDANVSIDEAMVPYYGHHGAKIQIHIHGKAISFGYKVWCLCSRLGYLVQEEPYQGASTGNTNLELGVGGAVLTNFHMDSTAYILDNFFTSVRLLEELKSKGHYCTGTIRSNRIEKASLEEVSTLKKKVRGSYSQLTDTDSGITLIRYHDSNIVTYSIRVAPGTSPKRLKKRVCDDIRLDGLNLVIVKIMTQIRCGECHKNTTMKCKKFNVGCHVHCSEMFHSR